MKKHKKEPLNAALLMDNGFRSLSLGMLEDRVIPVLCFHFVELYAAEKFRQGVK